MTLFLFFFSNIDYYHSELYSHLDIIYPIGQDLNVPWLINDLELRGHFCLNFVLAITTQICDKPS